MKIFEARTAETGTSSIVYRRAGNGSTICLLPSVGRGCEDFEDLARCLVDRGHQVLLPEPRGVNGSTGALDTVDLLTLANDVVTVVREEADTALFAGHAFGSITTRAIGAGSPDVVRGLAMLAAGAERVPAELSAVIDKLSLPGASKQERLDALRTGFFAVGNDPTTWLKGWNRDFLVAQRQARKRTPREQWWSGGNARILDLIGSEDPFRPPAQHDELSKEFGDRVTVRVIERASHALPYERPEIVAKLLSEFDATLAD